MPRHKNDGLKYFSFDTDFFHADKRIVKLHKRFGNDGIVFYIYLLTEIYRNGYYARWNEDLIDDAIDLNLTEGLIEQMMTFFKGRGLIVEVEPDGIEVDEEESNRTDTIITSPGIQRRYQAAAKSLKRDIYVDSEIWLLSEEETESFIKVTKNDDKSRKNEDKSRKNEDKSRKNDTKEKKEYEMKRYDMKGEIAPVRRFEEFWAAYPNKQRRHLAEQAYCELLLSRNVTEEQIVQSAKNYAKYIKDSGDKVFLPNNFLSKLAFVDYLDENYKPVNRQNRGKNPKNSFHNFEQREYDFDDLMKQISGGE